MAHVTFRIDDATLARVEALHAPRKVSLSAALRELILLGLEVRVGGFSTVHEAVSRLNGQLELLHEVVTEAASSHDESLQAARQLHEAQLDLLTKLGIETVMISRALASAKGRAFLAEAQQAARDYYAARLQEGSAASKDAAVERRSA